MRKWLIALSLLVSSAPAAIAQPLLPDPEQCLSSPGLERLAGSLFAQRYERGFSNNGPEMLPQEHADTVLVQCVIDRLATVVNFDRPGMRLQAKVVVDKSPQAFCIPAGYLYVTTGMLEHLRTNHPADFESSVAILLGHEIAHAVLRHSIQNWRSSADYKAVTRDLEGFQKALLVMNRHQELEADRYGTLYAVRAGYKYEIAFEVYAKLPKSTRLVAKSDSTHPSNEARVAALREYQKQLGQLVGLWDECTKSASDGQLEDARTVLEILVAEVPNLGSVHNNLGWVYYLLSQAKAKNQGEFRVSPSWVRQLGTAQWDHPQSNPNFKKLGRTKLVAISSLLTVSQTRFLVLAEDEFSSALQCDPDLDSARQGLLACLAVTKRSKEALPLLGTSQNKSPALLNLEGVIYALEGQSANAKTAYDQALKLEPTNLQALYNQAALANDITLWQNYLKIDPTGHWSDKARMHCESTTPK